MYDYATNNYYTLTIAGLPATLGTDAKLVATPSYHDSYYVIFASGTATTATATSLVNTNRNWTANQWTNYQVRILSGTGADKLELLLQILLLD